ncbi:MAG TPA: molybdate ABC transporter substrate-binding protein [Pirellulaceae bacterium]|nr:molybdate ABC transporter substrate-binding protein [Pirellulaceae bacterium]
MSNRRPAPNAKQRLRTFVVAILFIGAAAGGCAWSSADAGNERVTLLVAASAKEGAEEIAAGFEAASDAEVDVSIGGSNALAQQIIAGAPADLFLSASEEWADAIAEEDLIARRADLLSNRLVLVVPRSNPADVREPSDLLREQVQRVALAEENVPAGRYAEQALTKLDLFQKLSASPKIARGHDVRATLAFVERGEAEAGVVYATDAILANDVEVVYHFDPAMHDPIIYPLALLKAGAANPAAVELFERLQSADARKVFQKRGFQPLTSPSAAR